MGVLHQHLDHCVGLVFFFPNLRCAFGVEVNNVVIDGVCGKRGTMVAVSVPDSHFPMAHESPLLSPHCFFFYLLEGALNDGCQLFFPTVVDRGLTTVWKWGKRRSPAWLVKRLVRRWEREEGRGHDTHRQPLAGGCLFDNVFSSCLWTDDDETAAGGRTRHSKRPCSRIKTRTHLNLHTAVLVHFL